ncbi:aminoglycoside phosphotransferase family protein [Mycobacterium basiliense]|uniref:aminoglycoside phosphotransferase family protein n=1 Tax=Mycobacterium basiliense TaxID=2094119 RepID=UPI001E653B0B|nr:aminoglycoside phosphotransferase family protein [Mycobacterium basiliense]
MRRLIDSQFPQWSSLAIKSVAPQGIDNRTFRLGTQLSVRLPAGDRYAGQVAKEQRWLPRLAPQLPLAIPQPVAMGTPAYCYPHHWSVYRWLEGTTAAQTITDWRPIARRLAEFLRALRGINPSGGPRPGPHNFFRGASVSVYSDEAQAAIDDLGDDIDGSAVRAAWAAAVDSRWTGEPRWFHGDIAADNLLTHDGCLTAVIDFGLSGIGDPACDSVIAWTHFDGASRNAFRRALGVDAATWRRGRGWALWKALITLRSSLEADHQRAAAACRAIIERILSDHAADH